MILMNRVNVLTVFFACLIMSVLAGHKSKSNDSHNLRAAVKLEGYSYGTFEEVPEEFRDVDKRIGEFWLCHRHSIFDLNSGKKIGWANDCIGELAPAGEAGIEGWATYQLNFEAGVFSKHQDAGSITVQAHSSVQPCLTCELVPWTHSSNGASMPGWNNVVDTDGEWFDGLQGSVSVQGLIDLTQFSPEDPLAVIGFQEVFAIQLSV